MDTKQFDWQPIYFGIFSVTVVSTVVITGLFGCSGCSNWLDFVDAGTPKGVIYATFIVSSLEAIRIMVMLPADYLRIKLIEPLKQSLRDEGEAKGKEEGRAEMREEFLDWLRRKEESEREGREFYEPAPGTEGNSSANRNGSATKG